MGFLSSLLTFPVSGPVKGLAFIASTLQEQALGEMLDEDRVQQQLMELELRHDLGDVGDEEYFVREEQLLQRLDAIRSYKEELDKERGAPLPRPKTTDG